MSEGRSTAAAAFARPIPEKDLAKLRRPKSFDEKASVEEREAIRIALGLERVTAFRFEAVLAPAEGAAAKTAEWRLEGRIFARVAQACVVTLEPVPEEIDAPFMRLWSSDAAEEGAALEAGAMTGAGAVDEDALAELEEIEAAAELDLGEPIVERTPDPLDLGSVAIETLRLALDPYPRATGVQFDGVIAAPPGVEPLTDDAIKPFGGLAALKARMEGDEPE